MVIFLFLWQNSLFKDNTVIGQKPHLSINENNNIFYAFSDNGIYMLLKALGSRGSQHMYHRQICLDPVTLDDNSIELILSTNRDLSTP